MRASRRLQIVASTMAIALFGLATPAMASTGDHGDDPGDGGGAGNQPLPGYTVDNPPLDPLVVRGAPTTVHQGILNHAAFDIEVPAEWNGNLVVYAHGFRGQGTVLTVDTPPYDLRTKLVNEGYAWAASSYYDNGYDVRAGVLSTRDLTNYTHEVLADDDRSEGHHRMASGHDGDEGRTYLIGVSMGGHVTGRSIEQFPRLYDGAMPMCGVLGDNELFDFFFDENLVAQALAGVSNYPPTPDYLTAVVPGIQSALGIDVLGPVGPDTTTALGKQFRSIVIDRSGGQRPGANASFAVWKDFMFSLWTPDNGGTLAQNPGRLGTNVATVYSPNTPVDVNAVVARVAPTDSASRASRALTQSPQIFGRPRVPVLTMHDIGDLFVPFSMEQIYARDVARNHRSDLVVQRAVRAAGHCEFSPAEVARGFDDLVSWVDSGVRPAGDPVSDRTAVADPSFGCRFTDPSAFFTGSRPLFGPCP